MTLRAGQFVKPFGFDVPRSSADREFPERGMFAGYFFPGQRDRGLMLMWDAGADAPALRNTHVYAALLNGNRFFSDRDGRLDALFRVRRVIPSLRLAAGFSLQVGNQLLPPGDTSGDDGVTIVGADAQYVVGNLGLRFEAVHGTMPSTLLALEPEFAPAFAPGLRPAASPRAPSIGSPSLIRRTVATTCSTAIRSRGKRRAPSISGIFASSTSTRASGRTGNGRTGRRSTTTKSTPNSRSPSVSFSESAYV